ncbi:MAG: YdcF family protein [Treponema sp.]|nr:YdcF family protein [Treponema sp.]
MPPGCIIGGMLILGFILRGKPKCSLVRYLLGGLGVFCYLLAIEPVQDLLLCPLEDRYPPLSVDALSRELLDGVDALVILGGGTVQGSPEGGASRDSLSPSALKRLVYGFSLKEIFTGDYVLAGGKVFDYGQEAEAQVAAEVLRSLGLAPERIVTETESRNTWQNARNVAEDFGYHKIILVTSAYHIPRSVFCFEKNGIAVIPAPTDYYVSRNKRYDLFSFLPSMSAFGGTWIALHEYMGLLQYWLVYGRFLEQSTKPQVSPREAS